ncbi:MAG: hypothetical protein MJ232_07425 [archaeon]|nr:hypothetical protein [archaeon]
MSSKTNIIGFILIIACIFLIIIFSGGLDDQTSLSIDYSDNGKVTFNLYDSSSKLIEGQKINVTYGCNDIDGNKSVIITDNGTGVYSLKLNFNKSVIYTINASFNGTFGHKSVSEYIEIETPPYQKKEAAKLEAIESEEEEVEEEDAEFESTDEDSSSYGTPSDIFVEGVLRDYDFDGDGYISASEWNDWCMAEGYAPMSDCDLNGDGYCSKSELRTYSHEFGY